MGCDRISYILQGRLQQTHLYWCQVRDPQAHTPGLKGIDRPCGCELDIGDNRNIEGYSCSSDPLPGGTIDSGES